MLKGAFLALAVAAWAFASVTFAQQRLQPRIGVLIAGSMSSPEGLKYLDGFTRGLREVGYVSGKTIMVEYRSAERNADRLPELAAELVGLGVTAIIASGPSSTDAAVKATRSIPIVMVDGGDPVDRGFVRSLSQPGTNVSGLFSGGLGDTGKRIELLKETVPRLSRVAVLNPDKGSPRAQNYVQAAKSLRMTAQSFAAYSAGQFENALAEIAAFRPNGLVIVRHGLSLRFAGQIAQFALINNLPSIAEEPNFTDAGALMSYGRSVPAMWKRSAVFVDKILKGSKVGEIPVEPPPQFDLTLNLKTAAKLGLTIPPEILLEATEVLR